MSHDVLRIRRGKTFILPLLFAAKPFIYKPITSIDQADPARILAPTHGLIAGWPVVVVSAKGMRQINTIDFDADGWPLRMFEATVVNDDEIEINDVRAASFPAYTNGGSLMYPTMVDVSQYVDVRMQVKDVIDGSELAFFSLAGGHFEIDTDAKLIRLTLIAEDTAAFEWDEGVTDIEVVDADGRVSDPLGGPRRVIVEPEVTTRDE